MQCGGWADEILSVYRRCGDFLSLGPNDGIVEIRSGVQVNNLGAIAFWTRNGYEIFGGPERMPDTTTVFHLKKTVDRG